MSMNNSLNQLVPAIFDNPAWEDKIILLQFVRIKGKSISIIEKNHDVLRTLEATNPANLFPFKNWKLTRAGNIQFDTIDHARANEKMWRHAVNAVSPKNNPINLAAMNHIHSFRDIRSAQANDRDDEDGGY